MVLQLFPSEIIEIAGGREMVLKLVWHFYNELSFKDPILSVLYVDKEEPHHERFCKWLFSACGLDDEYEEEGGMKLLLSKHDKAKSCPLRDAAGSDPRCGRAGEGFTKAQRNRWLKYQLDACHHFALPREFTEPYIKGLTVFMNAYGPWTENRDGAVFELMQEVELKRPKSLKKTAIRKTSVGRKRSLSRSSVNSVGSNRSSKPQPKVY